jgi:glycosyltransferase involved in cell wall biosynthesis
MDRPRVLFVSRTRYRLPLNASLARKWDALARELELCVLATSAGGMRRAGPFVLVGPARARALSGGIFWLLLPLRVARLLRTFRPDAVVTQSPYEAAAVLLGRRLSGSSARIVTDVQGDWRSATRLYGSGLRSALSPLADAVATAALRRVDAVRTISPYTSAIVREVGLEPTASFPTFVDVQAFVERAPVEPPPQPVALFVGVLEPYKNIDGLADAWRLASTAVPDARLHVVGQGTRENVIRALLRDRPDSVRWTPSLDARDVACALDDATLLVLPSRSEGMGRVVIEAFCRSRPVIGTRVGGIPDLVVDGHNGLLIEPGSTRALAEALVRLLADRDLARRLGRSAHDSAAPWLQTPAEFASRTRALVERPASRPAQSGKH